MISSVLHIVEIIFKNLYPCNKSFNSGYSKFTVALSIPRKLEVRHPLPNILVNTFSRNYWLAGAKMLGLTFFLDIGQT